MERGKIAPSPGKTWKLHLKPAIRVPITVRSHVGGPMPPWEDVRRGAPHLVGRRLSNPQPQAGHEENIRKHTWTIKGHSAKPLASAPQDCQPCEDKESLATCDRQDPWWLHTVWILGGVLEQANTNTGKIQVKPPVLLVVTQQCCFFNFEKCIHDNVSASVGGIWNWLRDWWEISAVFTTLL